MSVTPLAAAAPRPRRAVLPLLLAYLVLAWLTIAAVAVLSAADPRLVNAEAWVRGVIVACTSVLTLVIARRAAQGRPRALLRLRIIVPVILVAVIVVLFFVPLPAWMIVEQAVCGAILLAAAILLFRRAPVATGSL